MLAIEAIKQLNRDNLPALTVVTGDDLGQYDQLKQSLLSQIGYNASDLTMSYFDMRETDFSEVAMDLESLPFFAEEKVIILDQLLDLTSSRKRSLSDEQLKRLEAYLEAPAETTRLILLVPGKLDGKRRIVKMIKRDGQVFEASALKEADLRQYFGRLAQAMGLDLPHQVLEELLIKSNFDFGQTQRNLTFLEAYKGKTVISSADIAEAIPKSLQDNIFDLTQLILSGKIDAARSLVRDLTLQGEDEIKLIAVMTSQFRLYTQVRILQEEGKREPEIVTALSELLARKVNPYQVKFALRDSRAIPLPQLKATLHILIETDFQIKSGLHDKTYLFDVALLKLAAA